MTEADAPFALVALHPASCAEDGFDALISVTAVDIRTDGKGAPAYDCHRVATHRSSPSSMSCTATGRHIRHEALALCVTGGEIAHALQEVGRLSTARNAVTGKTREAGAIR